jgi:predicted membrane protein
VKLERRYGSAFALILIVAGTLLFLDNLGVLPIQHIEAYWPLALVVWGALMIEHRRSAHVVIWASTLIVAGILLVLGNLHILHVTAGVIWPLALIAFGAMLLTGRCEWPTPNWSQARRDWKSSTRQANFFGDKVSESVVFSSAERRVESPNFEGGKLEAVFGGIELDLTLATITRPDRRAVIKADAVFGGIEIAVPRTWRVERMGNAVFGAFEDKTIPPRPEPGIEPPTLVIRGDAVFGAVIVKN